MSAGMPELGSKISLISKADIRYEGRLFTVDPQECTIALANVRSFGTEDRETQFPVGPQNQVYEYILFRGSDIKDIRVVNNVSSLPNDPAIVQMTVQASMGQQPYQSPAGYGHPVISQIGPLGGQFGPSYGMSMGAVGPVLRMSPRTTMNKPSSELDSGPTEPNAISIPNSLPTTIIEPLIKDQTLEDGVLDLLSGGSRATTPTALMSRKSPTMDQGTQAGHQQIQNNNQGKTADKPSTRHVQSHRERESHGTTRCNSGMSQYSDGKRDGIKKEIAGHGPNRMHSQIHPGQMLRGNRISWTTRGGMRSRGRGRGGFRNGQLGSAGIKSKNPLKFENDYDFEQANTEFEELRSQLAKTKIDVGTENEKKDDSGNETGAGEGEPEEETEVVHYDKSKSFFDNISCEAVERSKGKSQRTDWRTERKLNSETFGVASMRRGGYRGRGYYNREMGNLYRGGMTANSRAVNTGFRGNYRGSRATNRKPSNSFSLVSGSQSRMNNDQQGQNQSQSNAHLVTSTA